ncbi:unnamed protein product [Chironomus riparius]|uniref:SAGA-associated factor 11 n=1 Tax=Chironomus riparius TaxID=315576 RepID=A0A9N9WVV3_9DIPT|nr:unnamed protein product [Chironomus riparius]
MNIEVHKLSDLICANKSSLDECEVKLNEEYQQLIKNDKQLSYASEYIFSELIDDLILSYVFEAHFALKKLDTEKELQEHDSIESSSSNQDMTNDTEQNTSNGDTYHENKTKKKIVYCKCSNCAKVVAVTKFANHLEHCFGIGRKVRLRKRKDMNDTAN